MLKKISFRELLHLIRHEFVPMGEIEADFLFPHTGVETLRGRFMICLNCPTVYFEPTNNDWRGIPISEAPCHGAYWKNN